MSALQPIAQTDIAVTPKLTFNDDVAEARLMAAAKDLHPLLQKNTQTHHQIGELTPEVVDALVAAGLHNMAVPLRMNGEHLSAKATARVSAEIAKGCPSAAWCIAISNSCALLGSQMTEPMQKKIFADGTPLMTSSIAGMGQFKAVDGGYVLNGRWDYCSNSHHAQFALFQGVLDETQLMIGLIPIGDMKRLDNWDMIGMRGTGSDALVAEDVFIPADLTAKIAGFSIQEEVSFEKEASDYWTMYSLIRAKNLGVMVGAAEGLLAAVIETKSRPMVYSTYPQKQDSATFRTSLGKCAAQISSVRSMMDAVNDLVDGAAIEARGMNREELLRVRADTGIAVNLLTEATTALMFLAGSSAFGQAKLAQRYWTDFNVGIRHAIFNPDISFEVNGEITLGQELSAVPEMML